MCFFLNIKYDYLWEWPPHNNIKYIKLYIYKLIQIYIYYYIYIYIYMNCCKFIYVNYYKLYIIIPPLTATLRKKNIHIQYIFFFHFHQIVK